MKKCTQRIEVLIHIKIFDKIYDRFRRWLWPRPFIENFYAKKYLNSLCTFIHQVILRDIYVITSFSKVLSKTPPWLFSRPTIIFSLSQFTKYLQSFEKHFQGIIHSFRDPILCFTDGSKTRNKSGFVFTIGNATFAHRHCNSASVYTTKLQAILSCLQRILTHSPLTSVKSSLI